MRIGTFQQRFAGVSHATVAALNPSSNGDRSPPRGRTSDREPITARVNYGRWIADCPFCSGAEMVHTENLVFFCCECRNRSVGGDFVRVVMPGDAARIEELLVARPAPGNMNWSPGETLADLRADNRAHGVA